jgi:NAD+--dinitrogen-reductase ADP-D-ribosyltransferase
MSLNINQDSQNIQTIEAELLNEIALPINRCNVPPKILASLAFQKYPIPLKIDAIHNRHPDLFEALENASDHENRADYFREFMAFRFRLPEGKYKERWKDDPPPRPKINYRRLLLGWLFDSDNSQGAAWRAWVESRFGLLTRFHGEPIPSHDSLQYMRFRRACAKAMYNTNELETQLDLLYSYCQIELRHYHPNETHLTLYRGCDELPEHIIDGKPVKLFNNLNSFTSNPDAALSFGTKVVSVQVPLEKIACFDSLLPRALTGEQEYMVLGGLYEVQDEKI